MLEVYLKFVQKGVSINIWVYYIPLEVKFGNICPTTRPLIITLKIVLNFATTLNPSFNMGKIQHEVVIYD